MSEKKEEPKKPIEKEVTYYERQIEQQRYDEGRSGWSGAWAGGRIRER